jgi:hypothetical protein
MNCDYCLNQDLQDWLRLSPSCSAEANKFASALASCVDLRISRITVETLPATSLHCAHSVGMHRTVEKNNTTQHCMPSGMQPNKLKIEN